MEGELFSDIRLNNKSLRECEIALECNDGLYRLYVNRFDGGFYAMAVEFVSSVADNDDMWDCDQLEVNQLLNLVALFDGVRHLEFNREAGDMAGYIYYPNINGLIEIFQKIREIEIQLCRDCE